MAAVIIATLWALAAGMLVAAGTAVADLGVISLATLLIYAGQPLTAQQALVSSAKKSNATRWSMWKLTGSRIA